MDATTAGIDRTFDSALVNVLGMIYFGLVILVKQVHSEFVRFILTHFIDLVHVCISTTTFHIISMGRCIGIFIVPEEHDKDALYLRTFLS